MDIKIKDESFFYIDGRGWLSIVTGFPELTAKYTFLNKLIFNLSSMAILLIKQIFHLIKIWFKSQ